MLVWVMFCHVVTVGSLQFCNGNTIGLLEANQNRSKHACCGCRASMGSKLGCVPWVAWATY